MLLTLNLAGMQEASTGWKNIIFVYILITKLRSLEDKSGQ